MVGFPSWPAGSDKRLGDPEAFEFLHQGSCFVGGMVPIFPPRNGDAALLKLGHFSLGTFVGNPPKAASSQLLCTLLPADEVCYLSK